MESGELSNNFVRIILASKLSEYEGTKMILRNTTLTDSRVILPLKHMNQR